MNTVVITYLVYVTLSVALTIWVGRTLSKNGAIFLLDVFRGDEQMSQSVNHLLVVGFYLINLGYVALALKIGGSVPDARSGIENLATKMGGVLLVLGVMHFANLFVLSRMRRRTQLLADPVPPVHPQGSTPWAVAPAGAYPQAQHRQNPQQAPQHSQPPQAAQPAQWTAQPPAGHPQAGHPQAGPGTGGPAPAPGL